MKKINMKHLNQMAATCGMTPGEFLDYCLANPNSIEASCLSYWESSDAFNETLDDVNKTLERVNSELGIMRHMRR